MNLFYFGVLTVGGLSFLLNTSVLILKGAEVKRCSTSLD